MQNCDICHLPKADFKITCNHQFHRQCCQELYCLNCPVCGVVTTWPRTINIIIETNIEKCLQQLQDQYNFEMAQQLQEQLDDEATDNLIRKITNK